MNRESWGLLRCSSKTTHSQRVRWTCWNLSWLHRGCYLSLSTICLTFASAMPIVRIGLHHNAQDYSARFVDLIPWPVLSVFSDGQVPVGAHASSASNEGCNRLLSPSCGSVQSRHYSQHEQYRTFHCHVGYVASATVFDQSGLQRRQIYVRRWLRTFEHSNKYAWTSKRIYVQVARKGRAPKPRRGRRSQQRIDFRRFRHGTRHFLLAKSSFCFESLVN